MIHLRRDWNNNRDAFFWSLVGVDMSYDERDFSLLDEGWEEIKSWDYLALKNAVI